MGITSDGVREIFKGLENGDGAAFFEHVEDLLVKDNEAVVELHSLATAKNGLRFDNRYCWVVYFRDGVIVRVRAYLDSAMVARLFEENPIA